MSSKIFPALIMFSESHQIPYHNSEKDYETTEQTKLKHSDLATYVLLLFAPLLVYVKKYCFYKALSNNCVRDKLAGLTQMFAR